MNRLLIVYDIPGWAYHRRAEALKKYAPDDFAVTIAAYRDAPWDDCGTFDLVFQLEYAAVNRKRIKGHAPNYDVPLVVSYNSDSARRIEYWNRTLKEADFVVCNNKDVFDFHGRPQRTCCISNGVDTDLFRNIVPLDEREPRVFWCGSSGTKKMKGYQEVLVPAKVPLRQAGFVADFRPIDHIEGNDKVLTTEPLVETYNQCQYVVCTSLSEGTPNYLTEAVACGCVAVSMHVGNIREWGVNGENCVLLGTKDGYGRDPAGLVAACIEAREKRHALQAASVDVIRNRWSYGAPANRAAVYFDLFRRLIRREQVAPFSYDEL